MLRTHPVLVLHGLPQRLGSAHPGAHLQTQLASCRRHFSLQTLFQRCDLQSLFQHPFSLLLLSVHL